MKKWGVFLMTIVLVVFFMTGSISAGVNPAVGQRMKDRCTSSTVNANICQKIFDYVKSLNGGCPGGNACTAYVARHAGLSPGSTGYQQAENICKVYFSN